MQQACSLTLPTSSTNWVPLVVMLDALCTMCKRHVERTRVKARHDPHENGILPAVSVGRFLSEPAVLSKL